MDRRLFGLLMFAMVGCAATTQQIRDSKPELEGVFTGNQKMLASCVAERIVGGPALVPVLRDGPGPSTISATRGYMGDQILLWELRFSEIDADHSRVELRTRKTTLDQYTTDTDMWKAVGACSRASK